jgi:hypothetical protein
VDPVRVGAAATIPTSSTATRSQPSITTWYSSLSTDLRPRITTSRELSTVSDCAMHTTRGHARKQRCKLKACCT